MAIILGGDGIDAALTVGPNIVTDGLTFYIDPAASDSLGTVRNIPLIHGAPIDYIYGLLGDGQKVDLYRMDTVTPTTYPYYSSGYQGSIVTGYSNSQNTNGRLSKYVSLGNTYTVDIWLAPYPSGGGNAWGSGWVAGQDIAPNANIRPGAAMLVTITELTIATYGYGGINHTITQGKWMNLVIVVTPTGAVYYKNGKKIGAGGKATSNGINMQLQFTANAIWTLGAGDGLIGPVKAYNRDLTAQEVLQNYNAMRKRYTI